MVLDVINIFDIITLILYFTEGIHFMATMSMSNSPNMKFRRYSGTI